MQSTITVDKTPFYQEQTIRNMPLSAYLYTLNLSTIWKAPVTSC